MKFNVRDIITEVKIVFESLIKTKKCNTENWTSLYKFKPIEKLLNTKICITKTNYPYLTTGKIYEIKDGRFKDDEGFKYPLYFPLVDIEDLKTYFRVEEKRKDGITIEFVEVVEQEEKKWEK